MNKEYEIISLGYACMTRAFLTQLNLVPSKANGRKSMIFDLMPNPTTVIAQCIRENFNGYFDDIAFEYHPINHQSYWHNKKLDVYYVHDRDCKNNFNKFKKRYEKRIDNFREALNNSKFTYFVHVPKSFENNSLDEDINNLYTELKKARGDKPFKLIVWDILDETNNVNSEITVIKDIHPNKNDEEWWNPKIWNEETEKWKQTLIEDTKKEIEKDGFVVKYYDNKPAKLNLFQNLIQNKKIVSIAQKIFKVENDLGNNKKIMILLGMTFTLKKIHPFDQNDVILKLDGRMGNQMFQWAFARAYEAKNNNLPLINDSRETLKLGHFKLIDDLKTVKKPLWNKILRKIIIFRNLRNKVTEIEYTIPPHNEEILCLYQPDLFEVKPPAVITGYFQCYKYFENIREQLLKDFELKEKLNKANKDILEQIKNTNSVSIHFRRGDYLKNRVAKHFGNIGEQYYHDAIKYIAEHTNEPITLFVFSDDIQWVKKNVKFGHETVYVNVNSGKKGYFDIELMKNCKHNIIANSSFSWWGAWLNKNPEKIVVTPSPVRPNYPDYDKNPENWVKCKPYFCEVNND